MIRRLTILLLIVGCDNSTESKTTEWICTTDYQFESDLPEGCGSTDEPPCPPPLSSKFDILNTIYNSLEECESVCLMGNSVEISDPDYPDSTGAYISLSLYCKINN